MALFRPKRLPWDTSPLLTNPHAVPQGIEATQRGGSAKQGQGNHPPLEAGIPNLPPGPDPPPEEAPGDEASGLFTPQEEPHNKQHPDPPPKGRAPGSAAPQGTEPYIAQLRKFKAQGWKKDLSRILRPFFNRTCPPERMAEWKVLKNQFFKHLTTRMAEWKEIKETDPLQFMPYLEEQFFQQIGIRLTGLGACTQWIKPGSFYHRRVYEQGLVNRCPHLEGLAIPPPQALPTMQALEGHQKALEKDVEAA